VDQTDSKICTRGSARPAGAARHLRSKVSTFEAIDVILSCHKKKATTKGRTIQ
jgi:hypothetical protein